MLWCLILFWPSKIENSLILMHNMFNVWVVEDKLIKKCVFGRSELNTSVFWKTFHLILMHSIHKILCFEEFLHKIALFFKKLFFPDFWLIEILEKSILFEPILCRNSLKHSILWIKCMSMRWNAFQKYLFWTQFSQK